MKTCPNCGRSVEDDSVYCGYCDTKLPEVPEEEIAGPGTEAGPEAEAGPAAEGGADVKSGEAASDAGRCEKCGEQMDPSFFDTCWNCGAVRAGAAGPAPAAGEEAAAAPLLTVFGQGKRLEVSPDKVLIVYTGDPGSPGQEGDVPRCEISIKSIVSIELTNAKEAAAGCMTVNFTAAPPDDLRHVMNMSESVPFDAAANQEMAKALELIKRRSAELDAQESGS